MCDQLPEFVEVVHCMFLSNPFKVAQAFAGREEMLTEILEGIQADPREPVELSPTTDLDDLNEYSEQIIWFFDQDPGETLKAFQGHQEFLTKLIEILQTGVVSSRASSVCPLSDDSDLNELMYAIKNGTNATVKTQGATLLRSNMWIKADNPQRILEAEGVRLMLDTILNNLEEEELAVKCCQVLESLFDYKGVAKQADAASKQIITGIYIVAQGKTWEPANFLDGKTKQPILDEYYILNRIPYLPSSLSDEQKQGLELYHVQWVEPSPEDSTAAIPFIAQFMENDGYLKFLQALGTSVANTKDEFVAIAGSKVVKKLVEAHEKHADLPIQLFEESDDPALLAALASCLLVRSAFTDAILRPHSKAILSKLHKLQENHTSLEIFTRKSSAMQKRAAELL
eukprot:TRINITY_DN5704_c0_g1_i1.p1 TRINITY_DN5704_c0_g1~~TRINITY_DN5704_c0_g1_i1.p1  ORF type:complete len:415 (+),score=88.03 TRINITY_DN5704_c0_g1_i1:50-1246(+)